MILNDEGNNHKEQQAETMSWLRANGSGLVGTHGQRCDGCLLQAL